MTNFNWNATAFFERLTSSNRLAQQEHFTFLRVSGLEGLEEALHKLQRTTAFVAVSDIAQGYTELNNTPHTRRVKTVFICMRHALDNMTARQQCMDTMRELFRQFMSVLIQALSAIRVVSSAYLRLLIFLPAILMPACVSPSPAFLMMYSAEKLNKQGDNIQP